MFPNIRLRRYRRTEWLRSLLSDVHVIPSDLVMPFFVKDSISDKEQIESMPNIFRYSINRLLDKISEIINLGIKAIAIFPCVNERLKTDDAKEAYNPNNLICRTIKSIKDRFGDKIGIIADVALDPYTISGHDGILDNTGYVNNDSTIEILCRQALVQVAAGADIIAPSDMMDGRVKCIREALDNCNFINTPIMAYAAKFCSSLYSPFRDAIGSNLLESNRDIKKTIDKSTYQLSFKNRFEYINEIEQDIKEGADMIIIKPATLYLDVIKEASKNFNIPIFGYQVSGEYSALKHIGDNAIIESIFAIKRAGANCIITYFADELAKII